MILNDFAIIRVESRVMAFGTATKRGPRISDRNLGCVANLRFLLYLVTHETESLHAMRGRSTALLVLIRMRSVHRRQRHRDLNCDNFGSKVSSLIPVFHTYNRQFAIQ